VITGLWRRAGAPDGLEVGFTRPERTGVAKVPKVPGSVSQALSGCCQKEYARFAVPWGAWPSV
jgi:hypothetical protein